MTFPLPNEHLHGFVALLAVAGMPKPKRGSELSTKLRLTARKRALRNCQNLATLRNNQEAVAAQNSNQEEHEESAPFTEDVDKENIQVSCCRTCSQAETIIIIIIIIIIILFYNRRCCICKTAAFMQVLKHKLKHRNTSYLSIR